MRTLIILIYYTHQKNDINLFSGDRFKIISSNYEGFVLIYVFFAFQVFVINYFIN